MSALRSVGLNQCCTEFPQIVFQQYRPLADLKRYEYCTGTHDRFAAPRTVIQYWLPRFNSFALSAGGPGALCPSFDLLLRWALDHGFFPPARGVRFRTLSGAPGAYLSIIEIVPRR